MIRNSKYLSIASISSSGEHLSREDSKRTRDLIMAQGVESRITYVRDTHLEASTKTVPHLILVSICLLFLTTYNLTAGAAYSHGVSGTQLVLSTNPSATVIKVGDKSAINLTATGGPTSGMVCFSEQGFPSTGFTLTFLPQCAYSQAGVAGAQLIVQVTPAAAPQNFTALILATLGNQTASAPLTITVVPAIPAWIPWLGVLVFFLVIGAALFVKPRRSKRKGKMNGT